MANKNGGANDMFKFRFFWKNNNSVAETNANGLKTSDEKMTTLSRNDIFIVVISPADLLYKVKPEVALVRWPNPDCDDSLDTLVNKALRANFDGKAEIELTIVTHPHTSLKLDNIKKSLANVSCTGSFTPKQRGEFNNSLKVDSVIHLECDAFSIAHNDNAMPQIIDISTKSSLSSNSTKTILEPFDSHITNCSSSGVCVK